MDLRMKYLKIKGEFKLEFCILSVNYGGGTRLC